MKELLALFTERVNSSNYGYSYKIKQLFEEMKCFHLNHEVLHLFTLARTLHFHYSESFMNLREFESFINFNVFALVRAGRNNLMNFCQMVEEYYRFRGENATAKGYKKVELELLEG